VGAFLQEMLRVGIYKRSQGRITRQVTFAVVAVVIALGLLRLSGILKTSTMAAGAAAWFGQYSLLLPFYWIAAGCSWIASLGLFYLWFPGVLLMLGLWASYRMVNVPGFADFLIAVEAEMNKVSWPTRPELYRASMVVLIVIITLAILMSVFDMIWKLLLSSGLHII
jgi:preprotein translocase subunit SecE